MIERQLLCAAGRSAGLTTAAVESTATAGLRKCNERITEECASQRHSAAETPLRAVAASCGKSGEGKKPDNKGRLLERRCGGCRQVLATPRNLLPGIARQPLQLLSTKTPPRGQEHHTTTRWVTQPRSRQRAAEETPATRQTLHGML
ncbi:hypothetical protein E2C01_044661 [Portunus trituberculatus]|uniref:Uncharacterized protein n=1 Tax=Portunus trituberculatus TaxID=210409 RepID=A0A5B7G104_PORTR|nr:hypothetical protein [Portunus trituberculatus]